MLTFAAAAALFWLRGERRKSLDAAIVWAVALAMYLSAGAPRAAVALTDTRRLHGHGNSSERAVGPR